MRTGLAYTAARILLLVVSLVVLYVAGARGFLLLALAFFVSALASYILLSKQREAMAGALNRRLGRVTNKAAEFRGGSRTAPRPKTTTLTRNRPSASPQALATRPW